MRGDQIAFLVLFGAFAVGVWFLAHWAVPKWGLYFTVPGIALFLLVAWLIDRRSKRDSE